MFAKDIIVENAKAFVRIEGIPESPMENFTLENAMVNSKKLFTAHDAKNITIKNVVVQSQDSLIKLVDTRNLTFENVQFKTPGNEIVSEVSGELSENIQFKNTVPDRPKGWKTSRWKP